MKAIVTGTALAAAIALGVVAIVQQQRLAALERLAAARAAAGPAAVARQEGAAPVRSASAGAEGTVADAPEATAAVPAAVEAAAVAPAAASAAPAAPVAAAKPSMEDFFANVSSMMTNSTMKEMMKRQAQAQLDMQYGRLFGFLDQPEEVEAALRALLTERQMAFTEAGMAMMAGTPEERRARADEISAVKKGYDGQIEQLLGATDYDVFKQYEATQPERMQIEMLKASMSATAEPLTDKQEYDLVDALYKLRLASPGLAQFNRETPDPAQFSEENVSRILGHLGELQEQSITVAAGILTEGQMAAFRTHAAQQREMNAMGLKMAAQMFGGSGKK